MAKTTAWNASVAYFYGPLWASGHFVVTAQFSDKKRTPKIVHFAVTPKIVHSDAVTKKWYTMLPKRWNDPCCSVYVDCSW
jgi:hypothetical protein